VAVGEAEQALLERDGDLDRIEQRLREVIAGGGSLLVLEGPAGIGKTRLILAAVERGRELGLATLSARGSDWNVTSRMAWSASCLRPRS
jgi:AAA ATPase-like protein